MADARVILVTGSRKGIGRHLVQHFLDRGAVVIGCSRKPADWSADGYDHHVADVSDEGDVQRLTKAIKADHGRLDICINNAGVASMNAALLTPLETSRRLLDTNFLGTALVSREAAKLMMRTKWGRIINFSSIAVPMALDGESYYAASKAAVVTFSQVLAKEVAPYGITVNVVGPTPIDTDLIRGVPGDKIDSILERQALTRKGTFADVANVVDFFASEASDYITGQVIYLGGVS